MNKFGVWKIWVTEYLMYIFPFDILVCLVDENKFNGLWSRRQDHGVGPSSFILLLSDLYGKNPDNSFCLVRCLCFVLFYRCLIYMCLISLPFCIDCYINESSNWIAVYFPSLDTRWSRLGGETELNPSPIFIWRWKWITFMKHCLYKVCFRQWNISNTVSMHCINHCHISLQNYFFCLLFQIHVGTFFTLMKEGMILMIYFRRLLTPWQTRTE
jgi:hypothetical protein